MKLKFTPLLLLINLLSAEFIREEFEIRHRRSRLIRHRRHKNGGDKKIKQFSTDKTTTYEDNVTVSTISDELFVQIPALETVSEGTEFDLLNITLNADIAINYENEIDKILLFSKDNSRDINLDSPQVNRTESQGINKTYMEEVRKRPENSSRAINGDVDIVSHFLRIVESQHLLGDNCTAGTNLTLREGVVDRYAQERFRVEADVAVNKANMLTRLWKYADPEVVHSEYFLYASVFSMVEFDDVIFAAGNCYDQHQYKDYSLFCPYAYRLPEGQILVKDLAVEYDYMGNSSEWFFRARKKAANVVKHYNQFSRAEEQEENYKGVIDKLRNEITEKESCIKRLKRSSKVFEDDIMETEQSYISTIEEQKQRIIQLKGEISFLNEANMRLEVDIKNTEERMVEFKQQIQGLTEMSNGMITSIRVLENQNRLYLEELSELKQGGTEKTMNSTGIQTDLVDNTNGEMLTTIFSR
ncbi:unnamed protein product [Ceutorhynchus assimilis]|uniref:Uncharacterized protein n=1 Tax=Ceutorhynchus assimilis TaxID=467358 RepID=A0A9N9M8X2_9CUCU|nr:unnamed protein product [Ceutorhynchus assimilis]